MPPGRKIPRPPPDAPKRPPLPEGAADAVVPEDVAKAAGELTDLAARVHACEACSRAGMARVYGSGYPRAPVMLLKDRPSEADLESGNAFTSEAESLTKAFEALGIPMSWTYGTTGVHCGPNQASADALDACSVHLLTEIEAVQPRVIVAFGPGALAALRSLDGRCGVQVPEEVSAGEPVHVRADLVLVVTEALPDGLTANAAKRRLWRDLQQVPKLIGP
jgi:uracil-DNA glycosylase family 4